MTGEVVRVFDRLPGAPSAPLPPHNIPVEQALLGAILVNNEALYRVSGFLQADHFFEPAHGRIYAAASRLIERGQRADAVTLHHYFERDEGLKDVGGSGYLARLINALVSVLDVEDYGRTTFDLWRRRELIAAADGIKARAIDPAAEQTAADMLQEAAAELDRIADGGPDAGDLVAASAAAVLSIQLAQDIATGRVAPGRMVELADVDRRVGGLKRADLVVLAGRTSMGKSAVAVRFAERVATRAEAEGAAVLYFSLEMEPGQLANRILSAKTGVPYEDINEGRIGDRQIAQLTRTQIPPNLLIDGTAGLSAEAVRARTLRKHRRQPVALVVVDHIGLMSLPKHLQRENRAVQLAHITKSLKALAKEVGAPVLALSQLNREPDKRADGDKRPRLSDLRESGAIEQDADVVLFVYREEYYLDQAKPRDPGELPAWQIKRDRAANILELIVAKKRGGGTGIVSLYYDASINRFGDLQRRDLPQEL